MKMRGMLKKTTRRALGLAFIAFVGLAVGFDSSKAEASVITFDFDIEFSGATAPEGPAPWLTATFDDKGTPGSVELAMSTAGLVEAEYVNEWLFNFSGNPTTLF